MAKRDRWLQSMMEQLDLAQEDLPGQSLVEISGGKRVLVENYEGVTEYGPQRVSIRIRRGCVCVCGRELRVVRMTRHQLILSGCIQAVHFTGGL